MKSKNPLELIFELALKMAIEEPDKYKTIFEYCCEAQERLNLVWDGSTYITKA